MSKQKPVVGQIVFKTQGGKRTPETILPRVVVKVGRLYFTINEPDSVRHWAEEQVSIEDWFVKSDFSTREKVWESEQELLDHRESCKIGEQLRIMFGGYGTPTFPLEKLRRIKAIIEEPATSKASLTELEGK